LEKTNTTSKRKLEGYERLDAINHGADPDKVFMLEDDVSESQKKFKELLFYINRSEKIHNILNSTLIKDISECFVESMTNYNKENDFSYVKDEEASLRFSSEVASQFKQGFLAHYFIDSSIHNNEHLKLDEKLSNESKKMIEDNADDYLKGIKPFDEYHDFIAYYLKNGIHWFVSHDVMRGLEKTKDTQYLQSTPETIRKMEEEKLQWAKHGEEFELINKKIEEEKPGLKYQLLNMFFIGYCTYEMLKPKKEVYPYQEI